MVLNAFFQVQTHTTCELLAIELFDNYMQFTCPIHQEQ